MDHPRIKIKHTGQLTNKSRGKVAKQALNMPNFQTFVLIFAHNSIWDIGADVLWDQGHVCISV